MHAYMTHKTRSFMAWGVLFTISASMTANAVEKPAKYAVVRVVQYDRSVTHQVMSAAEYNELQQDIRREAPLVPRALRAAAEDWRNQKPDGYTGATEHSKGAPAHRPGFPASDLGSRQAAVVGQVYDDRAKAEAALNTMQSSGSTLANLRPHSRGDHAKSAQLSKALEMFQDQLNTLKSGAPAAAHSSAKTSKSNPKTR